MRKTFKTTNTTSSTSSTSRIKPMGKEFYEMTRVKAYEVYCNRVKSNKPGDAAGDWLYAERLLKKDLNLI